MTQCLALLRGINVGGNNVIRMRGLVACFEEQGLTKVVTNIQSGNVIFEAEQGEAEVLAAQLELALATTFSYQASLVLLTREQLESIVVQSPEGFGKQPDLHRYDVIYLKPPLTAAEAIKIVPLRDGVDRAFAGPGALYFSRLISRATASQLSRIIGIPSYQSLTIRNWNTTVRLLELMQRRTSLEPLPSP
jgi:uncharacterized protein (DUF1697 family)